MGGCVRAAAAGLRKLKLHAIKRVTAIDPLSHKCRFDVLEGRRGAPWCPSGPGRCSALLCTLTYLHMHLRTYLLTHSHRASAALSRSRLWSPSPRILRDRLVFHPRRCLVVIFLTILKEIILVKNTTITILETATAGEAAVVVLS